VFNIASRLALVAVLALTATLSAQQQVPRAPQQPIEEGAKALQERRFEAALDAFSRAVALQPRNASAWLGQGLAYYMMGRNDESQTSLQRALTIEPRLLDASLVLGQLQYTSGQIAEAIATYEAALTHAPAEARLANALTKWRAEHLLENRFYESRGAHFRVLFEGPADDALARRVVETLEQDYWNVGAALSTYPTQTIDVVLYTQEQFRDVTRSTWAAAAYDGRIRVPAREALAQPGELARVLVHELVHAFVATIGGRSVPTWLNEGLAVVLEPDGVAQSERALATTPDRVPLTELHGGFVRLSASRARIAYAESAVAVRRMLDLRGAPAMVALLADLAGGAEFAAAFQQRMAMTYGDFQALVATR